MLLEFIHVGDPPFPVELIFKLLGQIVHIVAPLADNKSDEMGSPLRLLLSHTLSGTLVNGAG